jgi:hypothetical protein
MFCGAGLNRKGANSPISLAQCLSDPKPVTEATYQRWRPNLAGWYCTSDSAIICWYRIEAEVRSPCSAN